MFSRGAEMSPFIEHVRECAVCRRFPRDPCQVGKMLLHEGAHILSRRVDKRRAKA